MNFFEWTSKSISAAELFDAFERRQFANFLSREDKERLYCTLTPRPQETTYFSSRAEFDAFVSKYMEQYKR
jgi:hypothetical protein